MFCFAVAALAYSCSLHEESIFFDLAALVVVGTHRCPLQVGVLDQVESGAPHSAQSVTALTVAQVEKRAAATAIQARFRSHQARQESEVAVRPPASAVAARTTCTIEPLYCHVAVSVFARTL